MEKKKMRIWKFIFIIVFVLLMVFVVLTIRKLMILSDLDKKVSDYENNSKNIHIIATFDFSNSTMTKSERFIKDDVDKLILEKTLENGETAKVIQITYPNERKVFTEAYGDKLYSIYKEVAPMRGSHIELNTTSSYSVIQNFAYSMNFFERVTNAIISSIKSVTMDGKECYELKLYNSNFLYEADAVEFLAYVEKDSGLPVKSIQKLNDGSENITTYECSFDTVTDEDMKEPDISEYTLTE